MLLRCEKYSDVGKRVEGSHGLFLFSFPLRMFEEVPAAKGSNSEHFQNFMATGGLCFGILDVAFSLCNSGSQ